MLTIGTRHIDKVAIIGLGLTGRACVAFLQSQGVQADLYDTRVDFNHPRLSALAPNCPVQKGPLQAGQLADYQLLLVSPGICIQDPAIQAAAANGCLIWGDVELFGHYAKAPVIGITGSNGKTTVTTLLGEMAREAGIKVAVGGNIGVPALELLDDDVELYILELSSFQLETTHSLQLAAATVLNLCDDHLDRYVDMADYTAAKQRIYRHADYCLFNREDSLTCPTQVSQHQAKQRQAGSSFGSDAPSGGDWGIARDTLCRGDEPVLALDELALIGRHNQLNALSALALGTQVGLPLDAMITTLRRFGGLPHRCELVAERHQVRWINDSKATNVGATLAALDGMGEHQGRLLLIAGGDAKGADLTPLQPALTQVNELIVLGRDGDQIAALKPGAIRVDSLESAVNQAEALSQPGDIVLLSPACASLDMFANYIKRGECFRRAVEALDE